MTLLLDGPLAALTQTPPNIYSEPGIKSESVRFA
jgi:hypothetical protein